jgi:hypothetical protein
LRSLHSASPKMSASPAWHLSTTKRRMVSTWCRSRIACTQPLVPPPYQIRALRDDGALAVCGSLSVPPAHPLLDTAGREASGVGCGGCCIHRAADRTEGGTDASNPKAVQASGDRLYTRRDWFAPHATGCCGWRECWVGESHHGTHMAISLETAPRPLQQLFHRRLTVVYTPCSVKRNRGEGMRAGGAQSPWC